MSEEEVDQYFENIPARAPQIRLRDQRPKVKCECSRIYLTDLAIELCIRRGHTDARPLRQK